MATIDPRVDIGHVHLKAADPDENISRGRPREEWPFTEDGGLAMYTRPLDLRALLAELK